ncbi:subclass B3 metallo-beta-lactamase [Pontixanthobacter aquaemixtae]|uniref:Subclass B3 metallo-beta-lactamase n=1 Tax=Pontixanthobacter aquaemixtae TaxID=1958940 RepID=A0A844ZUI9_9SPHN|nr:subclass B3 metallo-beta-lactamase [Pontixanthobacter aquaemixtae]MXO90457.1 subclass B3 metallo-beta-lactamase [Pontixanthobacter aquaemixtae]
MFGKPRFIAALTAACASALLLSCSAQPNAQPNAQASAQANAQAGALEQPNIAGAKEFQPFLAACKPWDDWDKPAPPFKVHGNSYYVGTCGIAAILITGDEGHVLIDTGTRKGAEVVAANIQTLGFKLEDVAVILHTHEHFDHVGGFAWMREQTGAQIFASPEAAKALESGIVSEDDPQSGMHDPMEPVIVAGVLTDDFSSDTPLNQLTMIKTPGHSPGALSWQWESCALNDCKTIVFADSLSPISRDNYRFGDHLNYLSAYREGIERLGSVKCDILLTPHPSHSQMLERMRAGGLNDPNACSDYARKKRADLADRLRKEGA